MPPYNNQMFPTSGMPQGQPQMGGFPPQMLQYLQSMQGAQNQGAMQPPGMQSMNPDQGMQQLPQAPPGWGGQGGGMQMRPAWGPYSGQGGAEQGQLPPGVAETMRGMGMGQPGGMQMPGGPMPMLKPDLSAGGSYPQGGWQHQGGSPPFMPPQAQDMRGMLPKPQGPPQAPQQAIRQPPAPRLPPNAGVYKNPATGQMMNQMPSFSGQVNPATMDKPAAPQTGGVMTMPETPVGPASDVSPVKAPPPPMPDKPKPIMGSPPFNPTPGTNRVLQGAPPQEPGISTGGSSFAAGDQKVNEKKLKAQAATRKFTSSSVK